MTHCLPAEYPATLPWSFCTHDPTPLLLVVASVVAVLLVRSWIQRKSED